MHNINTVDRLLRALLGIVLLELAFFWLGGLGQLLAYVGGAVLLSTSVFRFCPLYRMLGISTQSGTSSGTGRAWTVGGTILLLAVVGDVYLPTFLNFVKLGVNILKVVGCSHVIGCFAHKV